MEAVLAKLGNPGRYHCIILPFVAATWLTVPLGHVAHPFYAYTPKYNCIPEDLRNKTVFNSSVKISEDQCTYSFNSSISNKTESRKCTDWKFHGDSDYKNRTINTITTEWKLVCSEKQWAAHSTTFYMAGVIVGAFLFGFLADKFGRKKILIICLFCQVPFSLAIAFNPSFAGYCILKFILGVWIQGISSVGFVYGIEFLTAKYRSLSITFFAVIFISGLLLMTFFSFITNDWRHIQVIAALICFVSAPYIWWIPESPRWLMVNGRTEEVINDFIRKAVRVNGLDWDSIREFAEQNLETPTNKEPVTGAQDNMKALITIPRLLLRLVLSCYIWFVSSLAYYVILINIGYLSGNRYINYATSAAVEVVGISTVTTYLLYKHTRKRFLMGQYFLLAVLCILSGCVPKQVGETDLSVFLIACALTGKVVIGSIMCYIAIYTAEIFPTTTRGGCMAMCGVAMRVGGMLAPQIVYLKDYTFDAFPYVVIAVMTVFCGVALIPFPESFGKRMPNTIQDLLTEEIEANSEAENEELEKLN